MELAKTEGNPNTITRHEFQEALSYVGIQESDQEILDRLFTMFDKMGDNQVTHPGATPSARAARTRAWERENAHHPPPITAARVLGTDQLPRVHRRHLPVGQGHGAGARALGSARLVDLAFALIT